MSQLNIYSYVFIYFELYSSNSNKNYEYQLYKKTKYYLFTVFVIWVKFICTYIYNLYFMKLNVYNLLVNGKYITNNKQH